MVDQDNDFIVDEKIKILIDDVLHNNDIHFVKDDIDYCFAGEVLHYFEADTISEIEDYVKSIGGKIKAILFMFNINSDTLMKEVIEALNVPRPYCTKACLDSKFVVGTSTEGNKNKAKYRLLFAL